MREYIDDKLIKITCNMCGKESENLLNDEYGHMAEPFRELKFRYGYGSTRFDLEKIKFDLCEHCVEEIMSNFVHEADHTEYHMYPEGNENIVKLFPKRKGED